MRFLVLFAAFLVFGCGQPTAERYVKQMRQAQKLPMEQMVKKSLEISEEASKKLSMAEYSRFIQILSEDSFKDLAAIGADFSEYAHDKNGIKQTSVKVDVHTTKELVNEQHEEDEADSYKDWRNIQDEINSAISNYLDINGSIKGLELDATYNALFKKHEEFKKEGLAKYSRESLLKMKGYLEEEIAFNKINIKGEPNKTTDKLQKINDSLLSIVTVLDEHISNKK